MYTVSEQPKEQTRKGNEFISGTWMQPIKINVTSSCKLTIIILQPFCIVMEIATGIYQIHVLGILGDTINGSQVFP